MGTLPGDPSSREGGDSLCERATGAGAGASGSTGQLGWDTRDGPRPPRREVVPQTHGRSCGPPSRPAASPAGRRRGHTPGAQGRYIAAPGRMRTASAHTRPRRARGPPGRGSGRTRRPSSEAGTAPTGPAGRRGHLGRLPPTRPGVPWPRGLETPHARNSKTAVSHPGAACPHLSDEILQQFMELCLVGRPEARATLWTEPYADARDLACSGRQCPLKGKGKKIL